MAKSNKTEETTPVRVAPERLTRTEAANRVIAEMNGDETTVTALAEKAEALFVAGGGGKSNTDRTYWEVYRSLETAQSLGLVEMEEPDTLVRKVRK